jgi:hypothetical protein
MASAWKTSMSAMVAAYQELQPARRDVRTLCSRASGEVLEVAVVERTFDEMTAFDGAAWMS